MSFRVTPGVHTEYLAVATADYQSKYDRISSSLTPLIQYAYDYFATMSIQDEVPYFPLYFCATGGVRSLQDDQRNELITLVRQFLFTTGFYFQASNADIISGEMEGLFAWLAVNYRLSNYTMFNSDAPVDRGQQLQLKSGGQIQTLDEYANVDAQFEPVATLDMGGATIQFAFMQNSTSLLSSVPLTMGSFHRNLYVQCFWFYGKDSALWRIHNLLYSIEYGVTPSSTAQSQQTSTSATSKSPTDTTRHSHRYTHDSSLVLLNDHNDPAQHGYLHHYAHSIRSWVRQRLGIESVDDDTDASVNADHQHADQTTISGQLQEKYSNKKSSSGTPSDQNLNSEGIVPSVLASPCLPIGYETTFVTFDNTTVVVIGNANYTACYEIARHLVITRTTSPCLNTGTHYQANLEHFHEFIESTSTILSDKKTNISDKQLRKEVRRQTKQHQNVLAQLNEAFPSAATSSTGQCTSFFGKYQPEFEQRKLYAFSGVSYFPQFMNLTNPNEFATQLDLRLIEQKGQEFCRLPWSTLLQQYPQETPSTLRLYCWLSLYSIAILHDGLMLPMQSTPLYIINQPGGQKMSFAPGAMVYYVNHLPFTIRTNASPQHIPSSQHDPMGDSTGKSTTHRYFGIMYILLIVGFIMVVLVIVAYLVYTFLTPRASATAFNSLDDGSSDDDRIRFPSENTPLLITR